MKLVNRKLSHDQLQWVIVCGDLRFVIQRHTWFHGQLCYYVSNHRSGELCLSSSAHIWPSSYFLFYLGDFILVISIFLFKTINHHSSINLTTKRKVKILLESSTGHWYPLNYVILEGALNIRWSYVFCPSLGFFHIFLYKKLIISLVFK